MMAQFFPRSARPGGMTHRPIVIYDSGVGGLTVVRHLVRQRPSYDLLYVADNGWFPYGNKRDAKLRGRIYSLLHTMAEDLDARAIVIACNTASTMVTASLDDTTQEIQVFAVIPPVKQVVRDVPWGRIALLATPGTIRRPIIKRLVDTYASPNQLTFVPTMELVHLAERKLAGQPIAVGDVQAAIDPWIPLAECSQIKGVILGCTHFPWLLEELKSVFPAAYCWGDPALETANRVIDSLPTPDRPAAESGARTLLLTSKHNREQLRRVFAPHGFHPRTQTQLFRTT